MSAQFFKSQIRLWLDEGIYRFKKKRENLAGDIRINIGCGRDKILGWVNLDIDPGCNPDIVADARNLQTFFKNNSVQEISGMHILNYLTYNEAMDFFRECFGLLKNEGKLILEGPDLEKIILNFRKNDPSAVFALFATNENGPTHSKPYLHAWESQLLALCLYKIGFSSVVTESPQTHGKQIARDFRIIAKK
jgi:predicted SAM-dependent methyltransferase